ncbi:MAG TPA: hypothetical protein VGR14_00615, partial [Verrucomicrobiae bacterium]|nr:hypothetical protein [Verrucomicrobiae bacterium]
MSDSFGFRENQPVNTALFKTRHNIHYAELGIRDISFRESDMAFRKAWVHFILNCYGEGSRPTQQYGQRPLTKILAFVNKHTFHPTRVVEINNITLDEYGRTEFAHQSRPRPRHAFRVEISGILIFRQP